MNQDGAGVWTPIRPSAFTLLIGPLEQKIEDGRVRYRLAIDERHDNTEDRAHGGLVMSFLDEALGLFSHRNRPNDRLLTISFDCQFIDGARLGEFIEVEPEVVRATRSLSFLRGTCTSGGRVIATCSGVWKARPR